MILEGWMANTNPEEAEFTLRFLHSMECADVQINRAGENNEFKWTQYCDSDEDILNVLAVMLFYNDRSPTQIEAIAEKVRALLRTHPRPGES